MMQVAPQRTLQRAWFPPPPPPLPAPTQRHRHLRRYVTTPFPLLLAAPVEFVMRWPLGWLAP